MAGKNIQINLQFNANVQNAKAQLASLQSQLNTLIQNNTSTGSLGITPQIQEATRSAMDLKIALNNATNVNTGKLNLNKFQSELNRMGKDINYFKTQMQTLGPEGVKAFMQMSSAVAQAETKLFSLQGGMKKLANTFMNTVRWQLTSQAIMAVTSAISETINYAKELDTSLNNIRIVTGKSVDQMATFAKQANNAAKVLSTSTTKYTDASLIYYQQGLNDKAVKERTDVTVKLANVVGENAQTVSEWMTAIWNNFDDGSEKLEYYADVLAKLGAATASSADEIAGGLEKFAAVADTIGLSYEYAASALATITAETRQSEDVVGTALKTILSRMEQLKLGEVLDDGTTLGQYSLALKTVGVDIKEASGELKDMDVILQQTGTRWETLARDEQIALAQSVAGIRQYTQFMALMDNWDVMESNLELTEQANGALQEQQRIYEESTKAAEERMKVASEAIKTTLLGGDDLNKFYNFGAGALEVINELLEAFGGLPTILLAVASALTKIYQPQVASFMSKMGMAVKDTWTTVTHPIKAVKGENLSTGQQVRMKTIDEGLSLAKSDAPYGTATLLEAEADAQKKLIAMENKLSAEAKQRAEWELQILQSKKDQILQSAEEVQLQEELAAKAGSRLEKKYDSDTRVALTNQAIAQGQVQSHLNIAKDTAQQAKQTYGTKINTEKRQQIGEALSQELNKVKNSSQDLGTSLDNIGFDKLELEVEKFVNNGTSNLEKIIKKIEAVQQLLSSGKAADPVITDEVNKKMATIKQDSQDGQANVTAIDNLQNIDNPDANSSRWTKNRSEKALGEIDKNLGNIKEDKLTSKAAKDKIAQWKKESAEIKKLGKNHKDYSKRVGDLTKDIKKHTNVQDKNNKTLRNSYNTNKKMIKSQKELDETQEKITKDMEKQQGVLTKSAEATETSETNINNLKDSYDDFTNTLNGSNIKLTSWSDFLASGLSSVTSYMMGLNMLSSAFEQIGSSIAKGEGGFANWISNISSVLMGIGMLLPAMGQMSQKIQALTTHQLMENIAKSANIKLTNQSKKELMAELAAKHASAKGSEKKALADAMEALSASGKIVAQSWGAAIPIALMALGMIAPIIGGISSFGSAKMEQKQEEVSKGTESLEAINENQELAESVTDLTEEYNALRNAGESTADVLEDMREKVPELIDSYKELAKTMGTHIDTSELEKAYEVFLATGDTSLLEKAQEKLDKEIQEKEKKTAKSTAETAKGLVMDTAREGDGKKSGNKFEVTIGDSDLSNTDRTKTNNILSEKLGNRWNGSDKISFDMTNTGEVIDSYNAMIEARDALLAEGFTEDNNDYLRELNREIKEMSESMPDLINAQQQLFDIEKEEALLNEDNFNSEIDLQKVSSVEEYTKAKDDLIAKLKEEKQWTDAQAQAYLEASDAYGGYAEAADFFEDSGLGFNKDANEQTIKEIKEWFAKLPEEERTLAMTIDYTIVGSVEEAAAALEEARKKAEEAKILQEVESLEIDSAVFETYVEGLADVNKGLDKNSNLAKQVALNNLKISKGLETLTKNWDKNLDIIQNGNKASFEYAEAIGEVKNAFEEMFGVKPSTNYVEKYAQQINEVVNGNLNSLQQLQDALAEDYIVNMEISTPVNEEWSGTIAEAQNNLRGLLDDIDTSVEIGKESTLSSDFLNSVQDMLDAGVIAEDQLETLFRAKGYELNITGWKKVPGPVKKITQTTYDPDNSEEKTTKVIETQEDIQVPIINGDTSGIKSSDISGTASTATITKSTDKRVIDTKTAEEKADKKKDRLNDLKNEKDRYHEIDRELEKIEKDLDKISKAKDRAFGNEKLSLLDKEINKQNESIKLEEKRLKEAEKYYKLDREELLNNYAVKLGKNGNITNYEELQQQYIDKLKANAGNEEKYNKINEDYEEFKDVVSRYEESLNIINEQQQAIIDAQYELQDLAMEKIEYKVQIKVDAADDDLALIEFLKQGIEDNEFAAAEKIKLATDETGVIKQKIEANQLGISKIQRQVASGDLSVEDAIEKLREYRDEIIDLNGELAEQRNIIFESLGETFEAYNEELDRATEKMEFLSGTMEHYSNLVDIVGKKALGIDNQTLRDMSKETVNLAKTNYEIAKNNLAANEKILTDLQSDRANLVKSFGANSEEVRLMDEQIRIVQDKIQEGYEAVHEAEQATLEAITDDFKQHVELIMEEFENAVSGIYNSLDEIQSAFDRQKEINDRYLEQYEKTYEINKLNRQINQSLDKTDNLKSQKELRELQSQLLAMNKAGVEVSQRDIEYMQKKYELMLAQQALEDAQNAKSMVRLQRDSEGNYGYVYTADQNNIDSAQQNYEDKLYAMQKYGEESLAEIQEQLLAINQEFADAMRELSENNNLSQAEFMQKKEELIAFYTEKMRYWIGEANNQLQYAGEINSQYNTDMAANFNDTIMYQMYPDLQSFEEYYLQATEAMGIASQEFSVAIDEYYGQIQTTSGDTKDKIGVDLKKVRDDSAATEKSAEQLANKMQTEMSRASGYVNNFASEYGGYMSNIQSATQATITEVGNLIDKYETLIEKKQEAAQDYNAQGTDSRKGGAIYDTPIGPQLPPKGGDSNVKTMQEWAQKQGQNLGKSGIDGIWGTNTDKAMENAASKTEGKSITFKNADEAWKWYKENVEKKKTIGANVLRSNQGKTIEYSNKRYFQASDGLYYDITGLTPITYTGTGEIFYKVDKNLQGKTYNEIIGIDWRYAQKVPTFSFDTGGYTGEWGPEGRMAMLHQKEIVLNAHDTENFLTAIEIVRSIANQMNLNNQKLSEYATSSTRLPKTQTETLQQEVTIHAEFPNATNHNEIEEAFGNLVNLAAQYTNRKF